MAINSCIFNSYIFHCKQTKEAPNYSIFIFYCFLLDLPFHLISQLSNQIARESEAYPYQVARKWGLEIPNSLLELSPDMHSPVI